MFAQEYESLRLLGLVEHRALQPGVAELASQFAPFVCVAGSVGVVLLPSDFSVVGVWSTVGLAGLTGV